MTWHESAEEARSRAAMTEWDRATDAPDVAGDEWLSGIPHARPRDMAREAADVARLVDLQAGQRAAALLTRRPDLARIPCVGVVLNEGTAGAA